MTDQNEEDIFGLSLSRAMKATISPDALGDEFAERILAGVRSSCRRRARRRRLGAAVVIAVLAGVSFAAVRAFMDGAFSTGSPPVASDVNADVASMAESNSETYSETRKGNNEMKLASGTRGIAAASMMASAMLATPSGATPVNATLKGGASFAKPQAWVESVVPGGDGATISLLPKGYDGNGYNPWTYFDTNAVIGHVVVPSGAAVATGHLTLDYTTWMKDAADSVAPIYNGRRTGVSTNVLTLAAGSGENHASIEHLAALGDFRSWIDVETPLVLASDLYVRHTGKKKSYAAPAYAVNFAGGIATDGTAHDVIVSNDVARESVYLSARSDMDGGAFRLLCGGLRLGNAGGYPGNGDQLGANTTIDASSGAGWLDLGGNVIGPDKTLLLGGLPHAVVGSTCFGALQNNYVDPAFTAVWKGPVTLKSETSVGGCADIGKTLDVGGDLRIEGAISEENAETPLHVMTRRNVELAGANTYSGGTILDDGFLVVEKLENIGTGGLTFNGGTLRIVKNGAEDVSQRTISVSAGKWARFDIAEGVEYTLAGDIDFGSGRFAKSGRGKLVVSGANTVSVNSDEYAIDGGELVLDYSDNAGAKVMPESQASSGATLYMAGSPKITAITQSGKTHTINHVQPRDCSWPTVRSEGGGTFTFYSPDMSQDGAMLTVDAADGAKVGIYPTSSTADMNVLFSEKVLWNNETWAKTDSYHPRRFSAYTSFAAEWNEDNVVDVTAAMAAKVPATAFTAKALRFDDPSVTELTLPDGVVLSLGTILVTANRGNVPLTIRGGTIARSSNGMLRVLNFSDALVTVESDFVNGGRTVGFLSRGKVALSGSNTFNNGKFYVLGGELEMSGQAAFGVPSSSSFKIYLNMGGVLKTHGDMRLADPAGNGTLVAPQVVVQSEGGGICVEDGSFDISAAKNGSTERKALVTTQTGQFVKSGVGTLVMTSGVYEAQIQSGSAFNRDYMRRIAVTGGTFDLGASRDAPSVLGRQPLVISASGGATFVNAFMAHAANGAISNFDNKSKLGDCGTPEDDGGGWTMDVGEGGAVVDVAGVSVNMGQIGVYQNSSTPVSGSTFMTPRAAGYFCGGGDLTITNSSETAAVLYPMAMKATNFCGRLTSYVPFNGDENRGRGIEMPMAELHVPAGVAHAFGRLSYPKFKVAFAGLTGTGSVTVKSDSVLASYTDAAAVIGADDGKTYSFDGVFAETETVGSGGIKYMASRLIKVGANTQRLTNPENVFYASTTVRGGRLVAGAEGAVGSTMILLGDGESCSADTPEFVTDVAGTFGNEIRAVPSAAALPTVGGIQQSGTAVFTGNVTLWRDLALVAEGGDVRFDGTFTVHDGAMLVKKGGGTVALAHNISDLGGLVWEGGKVTSTGSVSFGEGASIALGLDPRELDKSRRYVILEATGGISDAPVGSLANGWVLTNSGSRVVLCYPGALTLLIR